MNIDYWRTEIDEIDRELLRLLNRRARLAIRVGSIKRLTGLPCCDPEREKVVLDNLRLANPGPLDHEAVARLFRRIIRESRRMEEGQSYPEVSGQLRSAIDAERSSERSHQPWPSEGMFL
jgi:chorismate mutase